MALNKRESVMPWLLLLVTAGCFPGVRVLKNPGPHDTGIRYYRPKPYLILQPVSEQEYNDQHVAISLKYLPDFSEEYSIHVRSGLGTADVQVRLDEGWNLTQINQDLDSQTDEIIEAVGSVIGKLPAGGGGGEGRFIVKSSNVPLGYYEAVIGVDPQGRKQLYGWRYIGFLPFRQCPLDATGLECLHCHELPSPIFGLVFENGTLTFRSLEKIQHMPTEMAGTAPPSEPADGELIRLPQVWDQHP